MFTVAEIKAANNKVESGSDFPGYIQEIKQLGVIGFETYVKNSQTNYFGDNNFQTSSEAMYDDLSIADTSDETLFKHYLNIHQQGETGYFAFCQHCAETGIEKWFVSLATMTCTYYDKSGKKILEEKIPG